MKNHPLKRIDVGVDESIGSGLSMIKVISPSPQQDSYLGERYD